MTYVDCCWWDFILNSDECADGVRSVNRRGFFSMSLTIIENWHRQSINWIVYAKKSGGFPSLIGWRHTKYCRGFRHPSVLSSSHSINIVMLTNTWEVPSEKWICESSSRSLERPSLFALSANASLFHEDFDCRVQKRNGRIYHASPLSV